MSLPLYFGPYGSGALAYAGRFAQFGANAAWFHGFDPQAFEVCARHDVAACVEFPTFRADFAARPELVPIGVDGRPIRHGALVQGVCLSQGAFLQEIEAALGEGLRAFRPAGVWLDYLAYAGWFETPVPDLQEHCFCRACIADFCDAAGVDAATPARILESHASQWARHKCERIAGFAARYAGLIRRALPDCVIGAYMCPWTPEEFDGALTRIFAQDYALLAAHIDLFTPLIYGVKSGRPPSWGRQFLGEATRFVPAGRRVHLILDALDGPESLAQTAASPVPTWGLQVFGGAALFADPDRAPGQAHAFRDAVAQIRRRIDAVE